VLAGTRILLVEDDPDARRITTWMLEDHGARVKATINGLDALQVLGTLDVDPDVILTDLRMPGLDGYGLVRRLQVDRQWSRVPVVALTVLAEMEDYLRTLAHGFAAHLAKPVDDAVLASTIGRVLRRAS
jgi:CheY-like chemotaxis protein